MTYRARWHNGVLRLLTNAPPDLDEGETVFVEIERIRSEATHRHQFAWLKEAWANLPESVAFEPWAQSPEALRKYALVATGFYEEVIIECGSDKMVRTVASELRKARAKSEGYAVAVIRDGVAVVRWPQSQSYKAMGRERFQASKTAIMDWIADLLGVSPEELKRNAA